jgi:ribosomal protein S18 acetylase RimI-like enzyme
MNENAEALDRFDVPLDAVIRPCRREDLTSLEWFGMFSFQRPVLRSTYEKHESGELVMLVADVNRVAAGLVWITLDRLDTDATAVFWALRVHPLLQNKGIGSRLLRMCEETALRLGFRGAEFGVEEGNIGAYRLYDRLGYRWVDSQPGLRIMRKALASH